MVKGVNNTENTILERVFEEDHTSDNNIYTLRN